MQKFSRITGICRLLVATQFMEYSGPIDLAFVSSPIVETGGTFTVVTSVPYILVFPTRYDWELRIQPSKVPSKVPPTPINAINMFSIFIRPHYRQQIRYKIFAIRLFYKNRRRMAIVFFPFEFDFLQIATTFET